MNGNKNGKAESLIVLTVIFTVVGMLVQSVAVLFGYDPTMHVYKQGSALGSVSTAVLFVITVLTFLAALKTMRTLKREGLPATDNVSAFLCAMSGAAMIVSSVIVFIEDLDLYNSLKNNQYSRPSDIKNAASLLSASGVLLVISILAGAYFILSAMSDKGNIFKTILGFFPPLFGASCLLRIYFDNYSVINDPVRILFQVSVVAVMMALLYELRLRVGRNGKTAFVIASLVSVILGFASAISIFILYFVTKTVTVGEMLLSVSEVMICLYLLARAYSFMKLTDNKTSEE